MTPTKEQIHEILGSIPREFDEFWYNSHLLPFIKFLIDKWESNREGVK